MASLPYENDIEKAASTDDKGSPSLAQLPLAEGDEQPSQAKVHRFFGSKEHKVVRGMKSRHLTFIAIGASSRAPCCSARLRVLITTRFSHRRHDWVRPASPPATTKSVADSAIASQDWIVSIGGHECCDRWPGRRCHRVLPRRPLRLWFVLSVPSIQIGAHAWRADRFGSVLPRCRSRPNAWRDEQPHTRLGRVRHLRRTLSRPLVRVLPRLVILSPVVLQYPL